MVWWRTIVAVVLVVVLVTGASAYYALVHLSQAPTDIAKQSFVVSPGETVPSIAARLETAGLVRSATVLQVIFGLYVDSTAIKAGRYEFTEPQTAYELAELLTVGQFDTELLTLTFIEGERADQFAERASEVLSEFDQVVWDELTEEAEGQLFPDTYLVPPGYTTGELVTLLLEEHQLVMTELLAQSSTTLSEPDIVTLASILEREANDTESMRTVAGILLNRLDIGMPLQADATIEYDLRQPLGELRAGELATELRERQSPYNTYLNSGLPPTPIGNPGRQALEAVINPISSDYFYYITGTDGQFYYAKTYTQHLINIERRLRQ